MLLAYSAGLHVKLVGVLLIVACVDAICTPTLCGLRVRSYQQLAADRHPLGSLHVPLCVFQSPSGFCSAAAHELRVQCRCSAWGLSTARGGVTMTVCDGTAPLCLHPSLPPPPRASFGHPCVSCSIWCMAHESFSCLVVMAVCFWLRSQGHCGAC